ncbi:ATP-binding cassette domain-containing protein, partial [Escherichia coli]|nr:ATP-binding cassette domain-containing protein [Escherichia coli]
QITALTTTDSDKNGNTAEVLAIQDLRIHYSVREGFRKKTLKAVNGIDLSLKAGECLGLVGESGCGKSTLAGAIMGLIPITSGSVRVAGRDVPTAVKNDPLAQA